MNPEIKSRLDKIRNGIVPEGYKKTKIGIIPEEWEMNRLKICFKLSSGSTKPNDLIKNKDKTHIFPVYGGNGIMGYSTYYNNINDTIIIGRVGEYCGTNRLIFEKCWITDNALFTYEHSKKYDIVFLNLLLKFIKLSRLKNRGGQPLVSQKPIYNVCRFFPPLPEQSRIATILSTWDKAIELKEKLIEQKKLQKKGLMQLLLTGKKRVLNSETGKQYEGEWEKVKLVKLIKKWADGGTPSRKTNKEYFNGDINWIVIDDIKHYIYETKEKLTNEGFEKCSSELWPIESVILSTGATIGLCGILKKKSATKQGITGIITKELILNNKYLRYWFLNNKKLLIRFAQGSSFKEIRTNNLAELPFSKPSIIEQQFIVSVLSVEDKKIELLENELEQLKEQKRGLMQLLLTGIVRVTSSPAPSPNQEKGNKSFLDRKDLGR